MKLSILHPLIALCAFAQPGQGNAAIMAEWHRFNAGTATFPVAATSTPDPGISSASMSDPVGLTKDSDLARFSLSQWNTGSAVDTGEYFEINLSINPEYTVSFSDLQFHARHNQTALNIHVRSDANGDNFTTDLGSFILSGLSSQIFTVDLSSLANQSGNVAFRFYGTDANTSTVKFFGTDNASIPGGGFLAVSGTSTPVPEPGFYAGASGLALLAFALWRRIKRN